MKHIIILFISLIFIACSKETVEERIDRIHAEAITIDTHSDTPLNLMDTTFDIGVMHDARMSDTKCDFPRMKQGGLDAMFFAVFVGQGQRNEAGNTAAIEKAHRIFKRTLDVLHANQQQAVLATTADDASEIEKSGKRAIYLGIENGYVIGKNINLIDTYYNYGARYITLCHTKNNDICDSANDEPEHNGLSEFGNSVVQRMNDLGMLIDVSHISEKAFFDVIAKSKAPVFASHSCAKAICDNPRNLSDEQLLALKANGGVVQMCILSDYVKKPEPNPARDSTFAELKIRYHDFNFKSQQEEKEAWKEWRAINKKYQKELATVSDAVDHIDHIVNLIGIDHVGIGTDFDGGGGLQDCFDVSEIKNITAELVRRNYSDADIRKIWGENFLRVFRALESGRRI